MTIVRRFGIDIKIFKRKGVWMVNVGANTYFSWATKREAIAALDSIVGVEG